MPKKVLLITAHFPPEISGGIGRPYSLYKYLPQFGYEIVVFTKNSYGKLENEHNIIRSDSFTNWRQGKILSIKTFMRLITMPLFRFIIIYPDLWWMFHCWQNIRKYLKINQIDYVYATFPSTECLQLGLKVSKTYNVPLIAEFRDGLVFESILIHSNLMQRFFMRHLENIVVKQSLWIVTVCDPLTSYFARKYRSNNVSTLYNGYDNDDFTESRVVRKTSLDKHRIVHFGNLNASRKGNRENLFIALRNLKFSNIIWKDNFELCIFGRLKNEELSLINQYEVNDLITLREPVSKKNGFAYIAEHFDYMLFYGTEGHSSIVSSKVPEYFKLGKPILGICKGNFAEQLIALTQTGESCGFDVKSIEDLFLKMLAGNITFEPVQSEIDRFDRKYQAGLLAGILDQI